MDLMGVKVFFAAGPTFTGVSTAPSIPFHRPWWNEPLDAARVLAVFATARRLRADGRNGALSKSLRGKNLALLLGAPAGRQASTLHRAALDLGARVAEIRFVEPEAGTPHDIGTLARLLGRMYDAIDCGALAPATVDRIEQEAGVPVYAGLGLDEHPARMLADLMTLCDYRSPPPPEPTILFRGEPQAGRDRAFLSAAQDLGFAVRVAGHPDAASEAGALAVDATHPPHWSLHGPGGPIDEARRAENHRCLLQAVLLDTMGGA